MNIFFLNCRVETEHRWVLIVWFFISLCFAILHVVSSLLAPWFELFSVVGTTRTTRPTWRKCKLNRNYSFVSMSVCPSVHPSVRPSVRPSARPAINFQIVFTATKAPFKTPQRLTRLVAQVSKFIHQQKIISYYMLVC